MSSFRGAKGDGGESALDFLFSGAGVSQLPGGARGESAPVGEGGMGASQLWSWVLLLSTFFLRGAGASQLWSWVLLLSTFFLWGGARVSFFRLACPTSFDTCQEVCSVRK